MRILSQVEEWSIFRGDSLISFFLIRPLPISYYLIQHLQEAAPSPAILEGENSWRIRINVSKPP